MPYPNLHTKAQKQAKVGERMHDFKAGKMHSGTGKPGGRVKAPVSNPKQAIAIALHETGLSKEQNMHHKGSKHHDAHHGKHSVVPKPHHHEGHGHHLAGGHEPDHSKHHRASAKHGGHTPHHRTAHTRHMGAAEHHQVHHDGHMVHHARHGHEHHAATPGFEHNSPHHHSNARSHHDGMRHLEHGREPYNPVEHGYGFGRRHDGGTSHGQSIAGAHDKHAHDALMQSIGGGYNPQGEKGGIRESKLRSQDNPRSDAKQARGRATGEHEYKTNKPEGKYKGYEDRRDGHSIATKDGEAYQGRRAKEEYREGRYRDSYKDPHGFAHVDGHKAHRHLERGELGHPHDESHEHHIAGGEHKHHHEHSGKAEHHPSVAHQEHHRFAGGNHHAHGYGHAVHHRHGHHRHSGHPGAHRIGHKG